jgi:hypothetical protein
MKKRENQIFFCVLNVFQKLLDDIGLAWPACGEKLTEKFVAKSGIEQILIRLKRRVIGK